MKQRNPNGSVWIADGHGEEGSEMFHGKRKKRKWNCEFAKNVAQKIAGMVGA